MVKDSCADCGAEMGAWECHICGGTRSLVHAVEETYHRPDWIRSWSEQDGHQKICRICGRFWNGGREDHS